MTRSLMVFGLLFLGCVGAPAARRVAVAQLEETLASALSAHKADLDVAKEIGGMELTERLTPQTLDRFAAKLPLQPRTALALQLLSDQSAFLDPPPTEWPAAAAPDAEAQQKIVQSARAYAVAVWGRLPNFFVSRVTTRFDDGAQVLRKGEWPVRAGLHPVGSTTRQIAFRDGKEVADAPAGAGGIQRGNEESGLRSWGEFGPALAVVLTDMAAHKTEFSHWEQMAGTVAAVFRYQVPKEASHYVVTFSTRSEQVMGRTQFGYGGRERSPQQVANIPRGPEEHTFLEKPAYHGSIAIDPATGAVLRITIETELGHADPLLRAATAIDYAPVEIGDRAFICPVRSLALSIEPGMLSGCGGSTSTALNGVGDASLWQNRLDRCDNTPVLLINETRFMEYHRLGSSARILPSGAEAEGSAPTPRPDRPGTSEAQPPVEVASRTAEATGQSASDAAASQTSAVRTGKAAGDAGVSSVAEAVAASSGPGVATPAPSVDPVVPEITMGEVASMPDIPAGSAARSGQTQGNGFTLHLTSRLVDVGLVAYDKKGRTVTDLKPEELELYDNGQRQQIRFLSRASASGGPAAGAEAGGESELQKRTYSNRASLTGESSPGSAVASSTAPHAGATVLLIDESHIAWPDLNYARGQMLKFLGALAPGERVGLYTMNGRGFRVLLEPTTDHAGLRTRLEGFMPTAQSMAQAQEEEMRNRQKFEEVHNVADLNSVNGNRNEVPDDSQPVDPQLLTMGSNPVRDSLIVLAQVARHLAAMPGHKNLVWVSSDNVFADWGDQQVGIDKSAKDVDSYALHAKEGMNEAHAAVYPFDVSQLEGGAIGADTQHRNVELTPAAADNAATAAAAAGSVPVVTNRNMNPGRITAEMSQDVHPIRGEVRDVAEATGGRALRREGDLAAALNSIVENGRATYQLSFAPAGEADDRYHRIDIRLNGRKGLTLRYRTGYVFTKEPAGMKDRFRSAIWRPADVSEIAVTADVAEVKNSGALKLQIAAGDLALEQQADRWMDKLDIFFIERDDAGLHARLDGQTLGLRLKPATYQKLLAEGVPFERAVGLQTGMASLRVLVVDENSGRMGSVTIPGEALRAAP